MVFAANLHLVCQTLITVDATLRLLLVDQDDITPTGHFTVACERAEFAAGPPYAGRLVNAAKARSVNRFSFAVAVFEWSDPPDT